jgi:mannosyltransferase
MHVVEDLNQPVEHRHQPGGGVLRGDLLDRRAVWLVAALTLLGALVRFWQLGDWSFQATEMFTLRDSVRPQLSNPRPLGYLLNYFLVRPVLPLDEFGLRLLPALFGVLGIPVLYFVARRLVGTGAALFCILLLTLSPLHVMYSQLARYWSLVFLLSAVYPFALYLGIRDRNRTMLVVGIVTAILAVLAHPVSILLLGGPAIWIAARYLRPSRLRQLWSRKSFRWAVFGAAVLAIIVAIRFVPLLYGWIVQHDRNPGTGQFLQRPPAPPGLKQIFYLAAYLDSLTVPVALGGMVGLYLLWRERDRRLAAYLVSLAVFPLVFLALLSLRAPVSQYYLLPTTPIFFIGAGVFLDRIARLDWGRRPRWLIAATLTAIFVASGMPTLLSDMRDGRRYDFKGVAQWLTPRLGASDLVFSDQYMVTMHYLPATEVRKLRSGADLGAAAEELRQAGSNGGIWIVAPAPSHPFRTKLERGGLSKWIFDHCQLRHWEGVGRVDLRQHYLQVFRCPPTPTAEAAATS